MSLVVALAVSMAYVARDIGGSGGVVNSVNSVGRLNEATEARTNPSPKALRLHNRVRRTA